MRMASGWRSTPFRLRCRSATRSRRLMAAARTGRACGWLSSMVALPPIAAANGPTSMACATRWSAANPDRKALLCCRAGGWSNAALVGWRIGAAYCATAPDGWMSQPGVWPSSPFCLMFRHCSIHCQSVPLDYENLTQTGSKSLFEITISTRYAKLAVPIFGSKAILTRTMPAWCLFNASGHGYRALTSLCRPRQPIEINDSNRLSGSDGCGGPARRNFFPPPRRLQALVLQIGKGDAGHQRVPMQPGPGPAFEVAEPELLLELLVHLLAGPARLDEGDQPPQRGPLRQVAEIVFLLAAVAPFADQPKLLAWQAGARGVEPPVRHAHPHGGEAGVERALGAGAP